MEVYLANGEVMSRLLELDGGLAFMQEFGKDLGHIVSDLQGCIND